jgi:hypothetical protein
LLLRHSPVARFHLDHRKHILTAFRAAKQKYEG